VARVINRSEVRSLTSWSKFDRITDALTDKLAAEYLEQARPDILAFTTFSKEVWRQIWQQSLRMAQPRDRRRTPTWSASSPTAPR
jgi:hypothetical protein